MYRFIRRPLFAPLSLRLALVSATACCLALASALAGAPALAEKEGAPAPGKAAAASETSAAYGRLPLGFEPNRGQADARAQFVVRGAGFDLLLTPGEAVIRTQGAAEALRMRVVGANRRARAEGLDPLAGVSNYFVGRDPSRWLAGVPRFARVRYAGVYPGVDLDFYGNPQQLEYDFRVAPGADPSRIALAFGGTRSIKLDDDGNLLLSADAGGEVRLLRPVAYQQSEGGERREVEARYQLKGGRVRFRLGAYDARLPLVIDPVVAYASFLGGSGDDRGLGVAVDSQGSAYVAGLTTSLNFPLRGALKGAATGASDAFVAKLSPDGSALVYATYFGGSASEQARAVAVDSQGSAYITGITDSTDLPAVNAFQPSRGSTSNFLDAFVAKLSPSGAALVYSTYLGGWRPDEGDAIAVDAAGAAYVVGATGSYNTGNAGLRTFPVTAGAFQTNFPGGQPGGGNTAAYVTKLSPAGNALEYSTFLGGLGNDAATGPSDLAFGVAVDSAGAAYVTGRTESHRFPVVSAAQPAYGGGAADAFLTKLDPAGTSLAYSTFLGGAGEENRSVGAVAVDAQGAAYAAGGTNSADFPVLNALQPTYGGNPETEAFLTKLDAGGAYVFSTYLGANNFKRAFGVAVDSDSNVYLTGTNSVRKVAAGGAGVEYAVTLGGEGRGVALDPQGNVYVAGLTNAAGICSAAGFFPSASAFQRSYGGGANDAFVTKVSPQAPNAPATFPVNINTGAFTGRYIVHGVGQFQGPAVLNLAPGTYTFDAFGGVGGSQFNFTVGPNGQLAGLTNNAAAQVCGNTLQLRAVTINVDPQGYAAEYLVSSQNFGTGFRTFTVIPGLTYIFESGGVVGGSTFTFNVGAGGLIGGVSNPASATASGNTLTLNNTSIVVNPGGYAGGYSVNRLPFAYGPQTFTLVPGLRYALESGAAVGGSAFTFTLGDDGSVVNIQVPEAATAAGNAINFNNVVVYVDPTTYTGAYRVQQGYAGLSGQRAVTLIPGLVAFAGTDGGGAYFTPTQTTVTPSSGVVTVGGQNHTFLFSLTPPSNVNIGGFTFPIDAPPDDAVILSNPTGAIQATSFACSGVDLSTLPTVRQKVKRVLTDANTGTQVLDRAQFEARYVDRVIVNEPGPDFYVFEIGSGNGNEPFALSVYDPAQGAYTPYVTLPTTPTGYFTCSNLRINYAAVDLSGLGFGAGARVSRLRFDNLRDPAVNSSGAEISDIMAVHLAPAECAAAAPVSLWRGDGTAEDSVGPNDGLPGSGAGFAPGLVGQAFSFDGIDDYVRVPNHPSLTIAGPFTVEFWFKPSVTHDFSTPRSPGFVSKGSDNSIGLANTDGLPGGNDGTLEVRGPAPRPFTTTTNWLAGTWYHAAVTFDGAGYKVYVNGVQEAGVAGTHSILNNPYDLAIGTVTGFDPSVTTFAGLVDEMAVYKRALSPAEVLAIHDAGSAGKCQPTNRAPAADAGPDQVVEATGPTTAVALDGSASADPDGDALAYEWRDSSDNVVGNAALVSLQLPLGTHTLTLHVDDGKGGTASDAVTAEVRDTTAPAVNCGAADGQWHNADVQIACTASDAASGLADASDASFALSTNVPAGAEDANAPTGSRQVCDNAGNCSTAGPVTGNRVDRKAPDIGLVSPAQGASYTVGQAAAADYDCADGGSGVTICSGTAPGGGALDTATVGVKSFTVIASDAAGNSATRSVTYNVGYGVCVLYDQTKAHKQGSTIPVKLQLCGPNGENLSAEGVAVTALGTVRLSDFAPGEVEDSGHANPDDDFRFAGDRYVFNLQTKGLTTGTYVLVFKAGADPLTHGVQFQIK